MPVAIRGATPADEAELVALWHACGLVVSTNDPVADFRFASAQPCSDVLVGENVERQLVGSVMVGHDGHRGWLYYVAAAPDVRDQGVGRAMVAAAEGWLRARGVAKAQLLVRETNAEVVGFYQHLGYETTPRVVLNKRLGKGPG